MKNRFLFSFVSTLVCLVAAHAGNIIKNGDFSLGNTNFSSDYSYVPYDYINYTLTPPVVAGDYTVGTNVPPSYEDWLPFQPVSGGSSQMLIANGAANASNSVWRQSVSVLSNTTYMISFYLAEISTPNFNAVIAVYLGSDQIGQAAAPSTQDTWQQFNFSWNSGSSTNVILALKDLSIVDSYNDFAIANISMATIVPPPLTLIHAGTNVFLMWPTNFIGFTLQSTTNLASPAVWTSVSPAPVVANADNLVTNTISGTMRFYRLSQ